MLRCAKLAPDSRVNVLDFAIGPAVAAVSPVSIGLSERDKSGMVAAGYSRMPALMHARREKVNCRSRALEIRAR